MNFKFTIYKPLLLGLSIIIGSLFFLYFSITKTQIECIDCDFVIKKNDNAYQIAYRLDSLEVISNSNLFLIASKLLFLDKSLKPGKYNLSDIQNMKELLLRLSDPNYDYISITIPEGWTINQISQELVSFNLIDTIVFDSLCNDSAFINLLGFKEIDNLEGYLFPDTYFISSNQNEQEIIKMMVQNFQAIIELQKLKFEQYGFNFDDLLILASIIQGEAMAVDEMKIISSVFHNRLNKKMFLDANATLQYVIPGKNRRLMNKDLKIESRYNTYKYKGLPPGPINNPGLDAIVSACYPYKTEYIYFVKDPNRFGKHVFSKTFKEHEKARIKYLKSLK
tara:strand:+ start:1747 stop:2754 length:1008 start_codon:yes stop_codon:yes gene_type:complete